MEVELLQRKIWPRYQSTVTGLIFLLNLQKEVKGLAAF